MSLSAKGIPVDDLCRRIQKDSGATCQADKMAGAIKLYVRLEKRSLADVMDALALLTRGTWTRTKTGYLLKTSDQATQERQEWWRLFEAELQDWQSRKQTAVLQEMRRPPLTPEQIAAMQAPDVQGPDPGRSFWNSFSPEDQSGLAGITSPTVFFRRLPASLPISPTREGGRFIPIDALAPAALQAVATSASQAGQRFEFQRDATGVVVSGTGGSLSVDVTLKNGLLPTSGIRLFTPQFPRSPATLLEQRDLLQAVDRFPKQVPESWKKLAAYQRGTFWPGTGERNAPPPDLIPERLTDDLDALTDRYRVDILSDYHAVPERPGPSAPRSKADIRTLEPELRKLASRHDVSWKRVGSLVLVRDNRWYRDDALEVAPDDLNSLTGLLPKPATGIGGPPASPAASLEAAAAALSRLSLWQIANGMRYYVDETQYDKARKGAAGVRDWEKSNCQPLAPISETILTSYYTCLFYQRLAPLDRQALLGSGVPLRTLPPPQAALLVQAVPLAAPVMTSPEAKIRLTVPRPGLTVMTSFSSGAGEVSEVFGSAYGGRPPFDLKLVVQPVDEAIPARTGGF